MQRVLVLLAFAGAGPACTSAAVSVPASAPAPSKSAPVALAAQAPASPSPSPAASATVRACRATPSTVYGDEPVVFDLDASAATTPAAVELFDQQGRSIAKAQLAAPGQWRPSLPGGLPSGDFRLQAGSNRVSCLVTVNRELPRGSQPVR